MMLAVLLVNKSVREEEEEEEEEEDGAECKQTTPAGPAAYV